MTRLDLIWFERDAAYFPQTGPSRGGDPLNRCCTWREAAGAGEGRCRRYPRIPLNAESWPLSPLARFLCVRCFVFCTANLRTCSDCVPIYVTSRHFPSLSLPLLCIEANHTASISISLLFFRQHLVVCLLLLNYVCLSGLLSFCPLWMPQSLAHTSAFVTNRLFWGAKWTPPIWECFGFIPEPQIIQQGVTSQIWPGSGLFINGGQILFTKKGPLKKVPRDKADS